jgi:hypothetical protein
MAFRRTLGRLGVAAVAVATIAAGSAFAFAPVHAQSPSGVPTARFYGHATFPSGGNPPGSTVTASVGGAVCSVTNTNYLSGVTQGAVDNGGNYEIDIEAVAGCTTPGATVTFAANGIKAQQVGTLPDLAGTAVHLDLTFGAAATPTATAAPPPPPPPPSAAPTATVAATPRPSTAPPPPPATAAPSPKPPTPVVVQRPVVQQAPKGPISAQGPARGPAAYQAPVYQAPAAGVSPRLPNTGTGGLLDQQSNDSLAVWALAAIVLAGLAVSASGLFAYRRSR